MARGPWTATGLLVLALALGTGPASAAARHQPALVSSGHSTSGDSSSSDSDASRWATSLTAPLFDPAHRWVPGDTETVTVWVRNPGGAATALDVSVHGTDKAADTEPAEVDLGALDLAVRIDGRPCQVGDDISDRLSGDTPARVDLTVALPRSAGNATQELGAGLRVVVRLTRLTASAAAAAEPTSPDRPLEPRQPAVASELASELPSELSVPVAGRHATTNGALPVGLPLTLAALALAARTLIDTLRTAAKRRHQALEVPRPCLS